MNVNEGKRFASADWADQQENILIIGQGGIGSWLTLNLARIGHKLVTMDGDNVDGTNVQGGQMFRTIDVGSSKAECVKNICREFGCMEEITNFDVMFDDSQDVLPITISGLDNMEARKWVFEAWKRNPDKELFIDGRLTLELCEFFTIRGTDEEAIREYEEKHLFTDAEAQELDCTAKQSTFGAMLISSLMTASLCNYLTNRKLGMLFREENFYTRMYLPLFELTKRQVEEYSFKNTF